MTGHFGKIIAAFSLGRSNDPPAWRSFGKRFALLVTGIVAGTTVGVVFIYFQVLAMDALIGDTMRDSERQHLFHITDFAARAATGSPGEPISRHHHDELLEAYGQSRAILTNDERTTVELVLSGLRDPARFREDIGRALPKLQELHRNYDKLFHTGYARYVGSFREVSLALLLVALLVPALAVLSSVFVVKDLISGLRLLVGKIQTMGNGGDPRTVVVDRRDEVGVIAATIDAMHAKMKAQEIESAVRDQLLIEQRKMGDIMNLAGGIAHEVANPLSTLVTSLDDFEPLCLAQCRHDGAARRELRGRIRQMREAVGKIEATILEISAFPGEEDEAVETIDINDLVARVAGMVRLDDRTRLVDFKMALSQNIPAIIAPRGKVALLLFNIIALITEYMHERNGTVTIDTTAGEAGVRLSLTVGLRTASGTPVPQILTERARVELVQRLEAHTSIRRILNELDGTTRIDAPRTRVCAFIVELPISTKQKEQKTDRPRAG